MLSDGVWCLVMVYDVHLQCMMPSYSGWCLLIANDNSYIVYNIMVYMLLWAYMRALPRSVPQKVEVPLFTGRKSMFTVPLTFLLRESRSRFRRQKRTIGFRPLSHQTAYTEWVVREWNGRPWTDTILKSIVWLILNSNYHWSMFNTKKTCLSTETEGLPWQPLSVQTVVWLGC